MLVDVSHELHPVTAPAVTLSLDPETCLIVSRVLHVLGIELGRAKIRYTERKAYYETLPALRRQNAERKALISKRMSELKGLPFRKVVYVLKRELKETWDGMEFLCRAVRREERRAALERRDGVIMRLRKNKMTAEKIAKTVGLSAGSVRNVLSKINRASRLGGFPEELAA